MREIVFEVKRKLKIEAFSIINRTCNIFISYLFNPYACECDIEYYLFRLLIPMQLFSIIKLTVKTRNIYNGPEAIASQSWLTNMLADNKLILTMPSRRNSVPTILLNP